MLPSPKHVLIQCRTCGTEVIVETVSYSTRPAYCSPECRKKGLVDYWRNTWPKRKNDPVAKEHVRKAKARYNEKNK